MCNEPGVPRARPATSMAQCALPLPSSPPHPVFLCLIRDTKLCLGVGGWEGDDLCLWYFSNSKVYGTADFRVGTAELKFSSSLTVCPWASYLTFVIPASGVITLSYEIHICSALPVETQRNINLSEEEMLWKCVTCRVSPPGRHRVFPSVSCSTPPHPFHPPLHLCPSVPHLSLHHL